jgi:hypothetical protein
MFTLLAYLVAGCSCRELPPPPPDETESPPETAHTAAHTGDSAPQGPCPQPEVEPNDGFDEAHPIALEREACGVFDPAGDRDYFTFALEHDAWLQVELFAADGSIADPSLFLTPEDGAWAAARSGDPESLDVTLRFPAPAGAYVATASEQSLLGSARHGYLLLASEAKPPVEWTRTEVEPNDNQLAAERLASGEAVFGGMSGNAALPDFDWYEIVVPAGKHTLAFEIVGHAEGSAADLTVQLWDAALGSLPPGCRPACPPDAQACVECAFEGGIPGVELDPFGVYESEGNEIVWLQVFEAGNREGPAAWYVLTVTLEGS